MPTACLCLLAACGGSTYGDVPLPGDRLLEPCAAPAVLPDRALTQAEVERWWGRDRTTLRDCAGRQALLVSWARAMAGDDP